MLKDPKYEKCTHKLAAQAKFSINEKWERHEFDVEWWTMHKEIPGVLKFKGRTVWTYKMALIYQEAPKSEKEPAFAKEQKPGKAYEAGKGPKAANGAKAAKEQRRGKACERG